mgnify:CR=1 FL=1|tara:strand:+ start:1703 stop:2113 length:411 start_codon:yes stop_codon:yes gene_type:complete
MAPIHITPTSSAYSPQNISLDDVKLTASISFRKLYPGRPLISVDNAQAGHGYVDVDGMYLNVINDTHAYRDTRDSNSEPVPLMALQAIFWNFRGNISFGRFDDPFDVVSLYCYFDFVSLCIKTHNTYHKGNFWREK